MAEKIRTSDVIADEIKEKLKSGEVKGEEIADLFREAYANLPNDKTLRDRSLSRLNSLLRNATGSKHKGLLDEEQKTDLRTIRDNGAMADKKEEPKKETVVLGDVNLNDKVNEPKTVLADGLEGQEGESEKEKNNKEEPEGSGILDFEVEDEDKSKKGATTLGDEVVTKKGEPKGSGNLDFEVEDEDKSKKGTTTLEDEVVTKEEEPEGRGNLDFEVEDEKEEVVVSPVDEKGETYDTSDIEWDEEKDDKSKKGEYVPRDDISQVEIEEALASVGYKEAKEGEEKVFDVSFVDSSRSKESLLEAVRGEKPEEGLAVVDDLLLAYKYLVKDNEEILAKEQDTAKRDKADSEYTECKPVLDAVLIGQLNDILYNADTITPDNALLYLSLCDLCGDKSLSDRVRRCIADQLVIYDRNHFGKANAEQLNLNYTNLTKEAEKIDPFANNEGDEKGSIDVSKIVFTDKDGNKLSEAENNKQKEAVAMLAREMACQSLAAKGDYTKEELELEIRKATEKIICGAGSAGGVKASKDGEILVNSDVLASTIANNYEEIRQFKTRVVQKFAKTKFAKNVSKRVDNIDKKLTERYGEKYKKAKKVVKFLGNIALSTVKSTAMFAVAGLVPGGTACVMGYNLYKSWKNVSKQLKDKDASLMKKVAIVAGTAATTTLTAFGISAGLGADASNLMNAGYENTSKIFSGVSEIASKGLGIISSGGGMICSPDVISSVINNISMEARVGIVSAAVCMPNMADGLALEGKRRKVNAKLKEAQKSTPEGLVLLDEKRKAILGGKDVKELSLLQKYKLRKVEKEIYKAQKMAAIRDGSFEASMIIRKREIEQKLKEGKVGFIARFKYNKELKNIDKEIKKASKVQSIESLEKEKQEIAMKASKNLKEMLQKGVSVGVGMVAAQNLAPALNEAAHEIADKGIETLKAGGELFKDTLNDVMSADDRGVKVPFAPEERGLNNELYSAPWQQENPDFSKGFTSEHIENIIKDDGKLELDFGGQNPDYVANRTEGAPAEDVAKTNLEAAMANGSSGKEGMSSYEHTLAHLEGLNDSRITDAENFAKGIAEHVGDKANLATIACKMAPYALQAELNLDLPDGVNPTSYEMLNYISDKGLTPEQFAKLNDFIGDNFNNGRFMTENFSDWGGKGTPKSTPSNAPSEGVEPKHDMSKPLEETKVRFNQDNPIKDDGWRKVNVPDSGNKVVDVLNDKYAMSNGKGDGYRFEPVSSPRESEPVRVESQPRPRVEVREVYEERQPEVVNYPMSTADYIVKHGLIYDARLSIGLDTFGNGLDFDGYLGAYINPHARNAGEEIVILPRNMAEDSDAIITCRRADAEHNRRWNSGAYDTDGVAKRTSYSKFGSGVLVSNNEVVNKVVNILHVGATVWNSISGKHHC